MSWNEIEKLFNRALQFTFSRKKLCFTALILIACGMIVVFCKTLSFGATDWVGMSLSFLPIFFCSAILAAAGIVLTRVYHDEVKQIKVSYRQTVRESMELMVQVAYFCIPVILAYILLWTLLGIFYLLKEIPFVGDFLGVALSFGPFLLLLGSFALSLVSLAMLFHLVPAIALKSQARLQILEEVWERVRFSPFSNVALLLIGLFPTLFVFGFMFFSAALTGSSYFVAEHTLSNGFQLFSIMLPFSILLSPAVVFFFNFSTESYILIRRKIKA